jgi:hypothetical protein
MREKKGEQTIITKPMNPLRLSASVRDWASKMGRFIDEFREIIGESFQDVFRRQRRIVDKD